MISISPIYATTIVQKIALYCSSYNGNDLYYLNQAISLLINLFGEDKLVDMLKKDESTNSKVIRKIGENWYENKGMKRKLKKFSEILEKINKSYSLLNDMTLTKEYKEKEKTIQMNNYLKYCKLLPKIQNEYYALFVFLIQNSSIQHMNISPQFLKILESGQISHGGVDKKKLGE